MRRQVDGLDGEVPLEVDAGTVVLVHYDIWHRGMPNESDKKRYMIKIMFTRIEEPAAPSWSNADPDGWDDGGPPLSGAWKSMWSWYRGAPNANGGATGRDAIARLTERLRLDNEAACLEAAYALAASGEAAVPALRRCLAGRARRRPPERKLRPERHRRPGGARPGRAGARPERRSARVRRGDSGRHRLSSP